MEEKKPHKGGKKKGAPKTGGRVKGTPNKTTSATKEVIANLLTEYSDSGRMAEDFVALEPKDRLNVAEKLMSYVVPKMQSVEAEVTSKTASDIFKKLMDLSAANE